MFNNPSVFRLSGIRRLSIFLVVFPLFFFLLSTKQVYPSDFGSLTVTSTPAQAKISINDKEVGTAPYTEKMKAGEYLVKVTAKGYIPQERKLIIQSDSSLTVPFTLESEPVPPKEEVAPPPASASLTVTSTPAKADIIINDQGVGTTPYTETLQAGEYILKITAKGYKPQEKKITIEANSPQTLAFTLESEEIEYPSGSGQLNVTATPVNAEVIINDQGVGPTPYTEMLQAGEYIVKVTAVGYKPQEKKIAIDKKRSLTLPFSLEIDPAQKAALPATGVLNVTATPVKAEVTINGKKLGETPYAVRLRPGAYMVKVTAKGYKPQEKKVTIQANGTSTLPFVLVK